MNPERDDTTGPTATRHEAPSSSSPAVRPGIAAWEACALAGIERMHRDEACRASVAERLS